MMQRGASWLPVLNITTMGQRSGGPEVRDPEVPDPEVRSEVVGELGLFLCASLCTSTTHYVLCTTPLDGPSVYAYVLHTIMHYT